MDKLTNIVNTVSFFGWYGEDCEIIDKALVNVPIKVIHGLFKYGVRSTKPPMVYISLDMPMLASTCNDSQMLAIHADIDASALQLTAWRELCKLYALDLPKPHLYKLICSNSEYIADPHLANPKKLENIMYDGQNMIYAL